MRGFKNSFAQVFSLRSSSAIQNTCSGKLKVNCLLLFYVHGKHLRSCRDGRLKVKNTPEDQMMNW